VVLVRGACGGGSALMVGAGLLSRH